MTLERHLKLSRDQDILGWRHLKVFRDQDISTSLRHQKISRLSLSQNLSMSRYSDVRLLRAPKYFDRRIISNCLNVEIFRDQNISRWRHLEIFQSRDILNLLLRHIQIVKYFSFLKEKQIIATIADRNISNSISKYFEIGIFRSQNVVLGLLSFHGDGVRRGTTVFTRNWSWILLPWLMHLSDEPIMSNCWWSCNVKSYIVTFQVKIDTKVLNVAPTYGLV